MEINEEKMTLAKLIPRLNYSFSFKDFLYSVLSLSQSKLDLNFLNALYETREIYFVNHARTGLRLLLNSLSLPANARIGVQVYNCYTVFNAICQAGYHPIFIDIDTNFRIDMIDLEKKSKTIDALIVTHTFGIPANIDSVKRILQDKPIIEDCAHAFLSKYHNKLVGKNGDAAVFSIGKGKFPSIGSGGFVIFNNNRFIHKFKNNLDKLPKNSCLDEILNIIKSILLNILHEPHIYAYITDKILRRMNNRNDFTGNFNHKETRILKSNLYLLKIKLQHIERYYLLQKQYLKELVAASNGKEIPSIYFDKKMTLNGFMFPILTKEADKLVIEFKNRGYELGRHFSKSIDWGLEFGYKMSTCPESEGIVKNILVFPCHYNYKKINMIKLIKLYESLN